MHLEEPSLIAVDGLVDSVTLLLTQVRMGEGLHVLQNTVKDVRHRIAQLFNDFVAVCDERRLTTLEQLLTGRFVQCRKSCADDAALTAEHMEYCIREVMVCFELARQICLQHDSVETRQFLLADLPILRPFDYPTNSAVSTATVTTSS